VIGERKPQRLRRPRWRFLLSVGGALVVLAWLIYGHPSVFTNAFLEPSPTPTVPGILPPVPIPTATPLPSPTPSIRIYHLGETQHLDNIWLTPMRLQPYLNDRAYSVNDGDEIIDVYLLIENRSDQKYTANPSLFVVQDSNGVQNPRLEYDPSHHRLRLVTLVPGGHTSGTVAFEVPQGDPRLALVYSPDIINPNHRKIWHLGPG
jgi:hypothetical protein